MNAALFGAPDAITGSGESGSASFDVSFGYTGDYTAAAHGLEAATVTSNNFDPSGNFAASSTNGGTDELIDIASPADGTWSVYVHGWQAPGGDSNYDMYSWEISATPGGNMTIDSAPTSATIGATGTIDVSWTGATAGQWHLGAVSHSDTN